MHFEGIQATKFYVTMNNFEQPIYFNNDALFSET